MLSHNILWFIYFLNFLGKFLKIAAFVRCKINHLSFISNAILYWNTIKINDIVEILVQQRKKIDDATLSHISLLPFKHVLPISDNRIETYCFDAALYSQTVGRFLFKCPAGPGWAAALPAAFSHFSCGG